MVEIYGLYTTRNGRVRYVGQSGDRELQFKEHQRSPGPVRRWIHHEWRHGYLIGCALLERCDDDKRDALETKWAYSFPRAELLNQRKLRPMWWSDPPKLPVVPEIVTYMRRYIFNVSGHRGVHHDRDTGYYRVLIYHNGYGVEWLKGDELPGGSAPIWFSDLARAVNARDKFRRHLRGPTPWAVKLPLLRISLHMNARRQEDIIASAAWEQERCRKEDYGW